ncbi:M13 family metallopeptidase [Undibacterium rugosum]|uniref:M13 family metallopeptidase n=1 Tax=Undibacterium rugosum TaxID=2762291 RepID=UPI001B837AC5|nr:M13 family metallopeptidase [Undibacterium rugosum]MBR7778458.1 M13 family metallopeptidase [Undibacterium rugosum]
MKPLLLTTLALSLMSLSTGISHAHEHTVASASQTNAGTATGSGVDRSQSDPAVRPQDDFFRHAQGSWLKNTAIPSDRSDWGAFTQAREEVQTQLRGLIQQAALSAASKNGAAATDANLQKIGDLYNSVVNQDRLNQLGWHPLAADFKKIDALKNLRELASLFAHLQQIGVTTPFHASVEQDSRLSTQYILMLGQSGLGLPNRDYYLKQDEVRNQEISSRYLSHVSKILQLSGDAEADAHAQAILALETDLAAIQWSNVENRDPVRTYNKLSLAELRALTPSLDWASYLKASHAGAGLQQVLVQQPSYLRGLNTVLNKHSLASWKAYLRWQLLNTYSPHLSQAFIDENFAFRGTFLSGIKENRSAEKRAVALTDQMLGEAVGKLYVQRYFAPETKARTEKMVANFLAAFKASIEELDWMSPETKKQAQIKLSKISVKVGYPEQWRDYSAVRILPDDLTGNLKRIRQADHAREFARLGKPVDRSVWHMTPQTVNAYYSPEMNEIVFPAARLQAPLFNVDAEDAFNYGALGISIGHEISHAFDDSGSQYDGDGNLRDWWTKEDREKFNARTKILVEQYNGYAPVPGNFLNGQLTLGENIADNAGLIMAVKAYHLSLGGKPAPVIDGWTAEQRLFFGLAQARRFKARESRALVLIKTDPHSPGEFRVNGSLRNHPDFYTSFEVKPGDKMYLPPEQRVKLW